MGVNPHGFVVFSGGQKVLGQQQTSFGGLYPLPTFCVRGSQQHVHRAGVADVGQGPGRCDADLAVLVADGILQGADRFGVAGYAEVLDDGQPTLAPGPGQCASKLLSGTVADGGECLGGGLAQLLVQQQFAKRSDDLFTTGDLQDADEVTLDGLWAVAAKLGGQDPGEPAAVVVVFQLADVQRQAMQCIVGFDVVTLAGRDEHVDDGNDVVTAAFVELCDGIFDLLFVDVGAIHSSTVGVGHLINKGRKF